MSFRYNGRVITLTNYRQVFEGYREDVLDEIRNAVLDDTPIGGYIDLLKNNPLTLNQVRLCIREMVPKRYININYGSKVLSEIRVLNDLGLNLSKLDKYLPARTILKLDEDVLYEMLKLYENGKGTDLEGINFLKLNKPKALVVLDAIKLGYPVRICIEGRETTLPLDTLKLYIKAMNMGVDIHMFLTSDWSASQLVQILSASKRVDIVELLNYINPYFTAEAIQQVIEGMAHGVDVSPYTALDEDSYPLFNHYQMRVLREALESKVDISGVLNPEMSDIDMKVKLSTRSIRRVGSGGRSRKNTSKTS